MAMETDNEGLKKTLGPFMLWGLGVGYVISGMYFGWNLGLEKGGTLGLFIALCFVILLYVTFTFSYAELSCAIPRAGGAFVYARQGLGEEMAFVCGIAQCIEFVLAPPAIAAAIGAYFHLFFPAVEGLTIAIFSYFIFTIVNITGVRFAAAFELMVTILAVAELFIFSGISFTAFKWQNLTGNSLPHGWQGIFASIPFAIWFFLGIEGIANVAEETIDPKKNILLGFGSAILTLVVLCLLTFTSAIGVAGWEAIVYNTEGNISDSPLPLALGKIVGKGHLLYHLLLALGLAGLIASFHGIILAAGRATMEMGRTSYLPAFLGIVHPRLRTPVNAMAFNLIAGISALLTGKTGEIIIIACFGALTLYMISICSLFNLRKNKELFRPFQVPFYPFFPATALVISSISFIAISVYYFQLLLIYLSILLLSYLSFLAVKRKKRNSA